MQATALCTSKYRRHAIQPRWSRKYSLLRLDQIQEGGAMLYWTLVFLVIAIIAGILGFTGVAVAAAGVAKLLFVVFLVLFVISLFTHMSRRGTRV